MQEYVEYALWLRGRERDLRRPAAEAVRALGLADRARSTLRTLSGGMRQRAAIAATIAGSPPLVVMDEPTVGLDPAQRMDFRDVLRRLPDTVVVLSTHLVEDVRAVGGQVAVLAEGKIVFHGTADELERCAVSSAPGDSPMERGYLTVLSNRRAA